MIFESSKMILKVVRIVASLPANDIYVCQDQATDAGSLYTVILIKRHEIVHKFITIFEEAQMKIDDVCVEYFSVDENFAIVFPYMKERPLSRFFMGSSYGLAKCEEICINLVINFMTNKLPYPLMYLALLQEQLHIARDQNIYLGYQIDLTDLDETVKERMCVEECAKVVLKLLDSKREVTDVMSYDLINKKIERHSYRYFTELYKDIRIAAAPAKKRGLIARLKAKFNRNKDRIFKILLVVAIVLGLFVALSFITNLLFGDIPWLRLLFGGFKHIGTQNLSK